MIIDVLTHLDKAAYLVLNGGRITGFEGKYWTSCKVRMLVEKELYTNTKNGIVKYKKYMQVRSKIKAKMRKFYKVER